MGKLNWYGAVQTVKGALIKHSSEILTGVGIAGMVTTTVLAVKATPAAMNRIEAKKKTEKTDKLSVVDTVKATWKCYISAAVTGVLSVGCLISGCSSGKRKNAALATAYGLSETALKEYRDKVVEVVGEKKEHAIRDEVAKEKIANNPVSSREIIMTDNGGTLCYDNVSGRYFYSDIEALRKAENIINRRLRDEMSISLNEFYDEIGLGHIGVGDDLGWNMDKEYLELLFSTQLAEDGRTPCLVMSYDVVPEYNYR